MYIPKTDEEWDKVLNIWWMQEFLKQKTSEERRYMILNSSLGWENLCSNLVWLENWEKQHQQQ